MLAATAAYDSGGEWLDSVLTYLDGNRQLLGDLLAERLPEVGYRQPEGTFLAWLDCRGLGLPGRVGEFFPTRHGSPSSTGSSAERRARGHVRLNVATGRALLETMVDRMAGATRSPGATAPRARGRIGSSH